MAPSASKLSARGARRAAVVATAKIASISQLRHGSPLSTMASSSQFPASAKIGPPPPPPLSQKQPLPASLTEPACTNAVVAQPEREFARHLNRRPQQRSGHFDRQKLRRYRRFYAGQAAAGGTRAERASVRSRFKLLALQGNGDASGGGGGGGGGNGSGSGWLVHKPARRFPKPRRVVSTDEIVGEVLRVHRERGHCGLYETWGVIADAYIGIHLANVEWVLERYSQRVNNACASPTAPPIVSSVS